MGLVTRVRMDESYLSLRACNAYQFVSAHYKIAIASKPLILALGAEHLTMEVNLKVIKGSA